MSRARNELDPRSTKYGVRFGLHLRALLKNKKLGSTEFLQKLKADGLDVSLATVGKWLSGDRLPRCYDLESIGRVLGIRDYRQVLPPAR